MDLKASDQRLRAVRGGSVRCGLIQGYYQRGTFHLRRCS
eukprot:COSAG02_NODE_35146_length_473_cov_0.687166_1_plen_38_part_10